MGNNMKSYLFNVLLFFLLSSAIRAYKTSFIKSDPTTTSSAPVQITDLAGAKQYLYDFGYMTNSSYPLSDILDTETISAINTYQKFFNLDVTGMLDNKTLNQMTLPRCVVPDLNVTYDLNSETNVSWPQGIHWFPNGTSTNHLTYGFLPESKIPREFQKVFIDAFDRWSEAIAELKLAKLNFTKMNYKTSDIKIGFYFLDNSVENVVGGTIMRYQKGSCSGNGSKIVGDIRLDASKYWVLPGDNGTWSWKDGDFDLGTVAMHQIGHILGLGHSSNVKSIMYPSILKTKEIKVEIIGNDKNNIKNVYREISSATVSGYRGHFFTLFGLCVLVINFSLDFILLFN
ncbi:PREDICTED: metalloendoproteinase 1-like [Lupinus angustifolius]|nr:PREDICTED: metalloendoproteinase 1-like [Lupinus angustifolius]